ncbi:hypothetical protein [Luteolibacter soli]|uniref:DUF4384 domain-containing protein n=1 Tax=Luteolibacter soli TaxID=3135280 RepID=A0ABU9AVF0_9BACT
MHIILRSLLFGMFVALSNAEEATKENTRGLPMMTWFHPTLEPGLAGMTLLCKVVSVSKGERYNSPYWDLRLRIEEPIFVHEHYKKRLEGIRFLDSGDFRKKRVGDQIIVFAGGEPYDGNDFLIPCWSGTNSDLGIALPSDDDSKSANDALLESLRDLGKNPRKLKAEDFTAFAVFCPKGVAEHFIMELRMKEMREDGTIESDNAKQDGEKEPATPSEKK